jgi:hypothetical protein
MWNNIECMWGTLTANLFQVHNWNIESIYCNNFNITPMYAEMFTPTALHGVGPQEISIYQPYLQVSLLPRHTLTTQLKHPHTGMAIPL